MLKQNVECKNCMKTGHIMKNCKEPVISYGLILYYEDETGAQYLMAQRKHSLGFLEFFAGRYSENDLDFIEVLFNQFTRNEFELVRDSKSFDDIVEHFGLDIEKYCKPSYYGYTAYNTVYDTGILKHICNLIDPTTLSIEHEWMFPKGRRNFNESEIDCSKREFLEETGIESSMYDFDGTPNISELFFGTNGKLYKHTYFLVKANHITFSKESFLNNFKESFEIQQIAFFDKETCMEKMSLIFLNQRRLIFFNNLLR